MDYEQLIGQFERITDAALSFREAAETFARNANGTRQHIIPAPTAYELLGHLKLALGHIGEVAEFLPDGLQNSLENSMVTITDRDFLTGEVRDPEESVALSSQALIQLSGAITVAATCAETAQGALSNQGYEPVSINEATTLIDNSAHVLA